MLFSSLLKLSALATFVAGQTSYVETFSKNTSDTTPATIPGVDRALQWTGVRPVTATNGGIRPDGTYYGVFDGSFTASVKYTGSTVKHFTPSTWKMGVARLANGVYTPTGDGTVKVEARDENGIKATDYFTYPAPRVCPAGSTSCPLYNFGFAQPAYTNIQSLTFSLQPYTGTTPGKLYAYVDDIAYTAQ